MLRRCLPSVCWQLPPRLSHRHSTSAQTAPSRQARGCCTTHCLAMGAETEQALPAATAPDEDRVPWYAKAGRPNHHKVTSSRGFVGQRTLAATEYHDSDFSWPQHAAEVEVRAQGSTSSSPSGGLPLLRPQQQGVSFDASSNGLPPSLQAVCCPPGTTTASVESPQPAAPATQQPTSSGSSLQTQCWDNFHASSNCSARFYKERRYLMLEFPCLMIPNQHIFEIGCGCGSSLLPILKANITSRVTATDLSPTAVRLFCEAAEVASIDSSRYEAFPLDAVAADAAHLTPTGADAVLLVFTLAALPPAQMHAMLSCAFQALKPGGRLLVRDHGLYDLTHLRLAPEQEVEPRLFRRLDGTLCYFFTTDDLADRAAMAGFQIEECRYACTELLNRRKAMPMRRVFVHAVLRRPLV